MSNHRKKVDWDKPGTRTCYRCKQVLELSEEYFYKKASPKDGGFRRECIKCCQETNQNWVNRMKVKSGVHPRLDYKYRTRYGITYNIKQEMIANQKGLCLICQKVLDKPHIDHDHDTGKVRGILCHHCNTALGNFQDNVILLQRAIDYLQDRLIAEPLAPNNTERLRIVS